MPRIPIANPALVQPTGQPRGAVATPDTPAAPFAQDSSLLAVPRSLSNVGESVTQAAEISQRLSNAQKAAQRSQDILDAEQQTQEFEIAMQDAFAEMAATGDFRTIPEDIVAQGRETIATMRQGLNRDAGQRFETKAIDFLGTLQAKALGVRTARREEQKTFVAQRGIDLHIRGIAEATDSAEAEYHRASLAGMLEDGVKSGLWKGGQAATLYQKALDDAETLSWSNRIRIDPEGAEESLREQAEAGETLIGNKPIAELIDQAQSERRELFRDAEEQERAAGQRLERTQLEHESRLANQVDTATTMEELQAIEKTIRRMGEDPSEGGLTLSSFNRLRSDINARKKALLEEREGVSDPATLNNLRLAVFGGRGLRPPHETMEIRRSLYGAIETGLVRWKDVKDLIGELNNEMDDNYYTKADGYSQAERDLDRALNTTNPFQDFDPRGEALKVVAKREFNDRIQEVWEQGGNRAVTQQLRDIQRDIENNYAEQTLKAIRNALQIPPRELPPEILDESGLTDKSAMQDIQARFEAARQKIVDMQRTGQVRDPAQLERWIVTLDQRARWWGLVIGMLTNLPFRARGQGTAGSGQFEQQRR